MFLERILQRERGGWRGPSTSTVSGEEQGPSIVESRAVEIRNEDLLSHGNRATVSMSPVSRSLKPTTTRSPVHW